MKAVISRDFAPRPHRLGLAFVLLWTVYPASAVASGPSGGGVQPLALSGAQAEPRELACPDSSEPPRVYMIGSSTMGHPLGPMLVKALGAWGVTAKRWARASSGLARPDFFDWEAKIPQIIKRHDPDVWVVALGTNDNQGLVVPRTGKKKRRWINFRRDEWAKIYAQRIDRLLSLMSGDRGRPIIWFSPVGFYGRSVTWGARITELMRKRIAAFDGPVVFIDLFKDTVVDGKAVSWFRPPEAKRRVKMRAGDNIHLSRRAVQHYMRDPVLALLAPCWQDRALTSP